MQGHTTFSARLRAGLGGVLIALALATLPTDRTLWASATSGADSKLTLGTSFNYQGHLERFGEPAEGRFDLSFEVFDRRLGGTYLGRLERLDVELVGGAFSTELDFGIDVFSGPAPWVALSVRPAGSGDFSSLGGRQRLVGTRGAGCTVDKDVRINGQLSVDAPGAAATDIAVEDGRLFVKGAAAGSGLTMNSTGFSGASAFGLAGPLFLNAAGGDVGIRTTTTAAPLTVSGSPDASPSGGGAVVIGDTAGPNIAIDSNEIMARNAGAPAPLTLNNDGGVVQIGGSVDIGLSLATNTEDSTYVTVGCPANLKVLSGGCVSVSRQLISFPFDDDVWVCGFEDPEEDNFAFALCGRLE